MSKRTYEHPLVEIAYMKLLDVKTEKQFDEYAELIDKLYERGIMLHDDNYDLYNKAYEQVYGHPAFDDDGNCID